MFEKQNKPTVPCSLVINVSCGDTPILVHSLPHIIDSHKITFSEIVIAVDEKPAEGRIRSQSHQHSLESLYEELCKVEQMGYCFTRKSVSYTQDDIHSTFLKWFGNSDVTLRCAGGTPIYAFLFALDLASQEYVLHLDSDMLIYDPKPDSWISEAIRILNNVPEILFVNQTWGLQTEEVPAPQEMPSFDLGYEQRVSQIFSSRCFLFSLDKLKRSFLPITAQRHPLLKQAQYRLQGRSTYIALEQMVSKSLQHANVYRADLGLEWGLNLHAWDKSIFGHESIEDVIARIEVGAIPKTHCGNHDLDYGLFVKSIDAESPNA